MKRSAIVKGLGAALVAATGLGMAGQASADVYGVGLVDVSGLRITFPGDTNPLDDVGTWQFATSGQAQLDGVSAFPPSLRTCNGNGFLDQGNCDNGAGAGDVLSGPVQNAPGSDGVVRGEGDYTVYGTGVGDYSTAESAIIDAQIVGDIVGGTHVAGISEGNLSGDWSAAANTNTSSTTSVTLDFTLGPDSDGVDISFDANWVNEVSITDPDDGIAQASISGLVRITGTSGDALGTVIFWNPGSDPICSGGLVCNASFAGVGSGNLNSTVSIDNIGSDTNTGNGSFSFDARGMLSGDYSIALNITTSNVLTRVPVPGTLLLMGAGLLGAAGMRRRKA